jgi:hypothetical protein
MADVEPGTPRRTTEGTDLETLARIIRDLRAEVAQLRRAMPAHSGVAIGDTSERPAEPYLGQMFYDFMLGRPIWASSVEPTVIWKDAAGLDV